VWQVDNRTPFAAERGWVRDRNGAEIWLVAVKCTFDIGPDGATKVSAEQPPVLRVPEYHGEPGKSSIKYENDLVLTKTTTDVLVVGHGYAPGSNPVTEFDVGFRVGPIQKLLRVFGDREWTGSAPSSPLPCVKMPLVYERAYGGIDRKSSRPDQDWDWRNPVGTGFAAEKASLDGVLLPNIEYPGKAMRSWDDRPPPAGFGVIGGHWQPLAETDLRLRAEYVHETIDHPQASFPSASEAIEDAFPDRFERDADGNLVRVDLRPVNFKQSRRDTVR